MLVKEKRFVFVGGGWVMNDEALPTYKGVILQMRTGLDFLRDTFNVRPLIAWQIDPFGSSALTVATFYKLGYEALVENRISADFKKHNRFNFMWQGHQVTSNKSEASLFTHILTRHYNIPGIWSENQFLSMSVNTLKDKFWRLEVVPAVNEIKDISSPQLEDYNIMMTAGDDFTYVQADRVFSHYAELAQTTTKMGEKEGYETKMGFRSLYEYFESIKKMGITYGYFKGDFLPFQESYSHWDEFWTGYYSSRLHMKRLIRHVFNDIQSTKTLLAIRAKSTNSGTIFFNDELANNTDKINEYIIGAERNWSILMHHDGITGTHAAKTEPSYYKILEDALSFLDKARTKMDEVFPSGLSKTMVDSLKSIYDKLNDPSIDFHTIVNPAGYYRIQIMNITLTGERGDNYVACLLQDGRLDCSVDSYYTDIIRLEGSNSTSLKPTLFVKVPMVALSYSQLIVSQNWLHI